MNTLQYILWKSLNKEESSFTIWKRNCEHFTSCYVLYWEHVEVCASTKITMVILLGPISRCSENGIWTTDCCMYGGWQKHYQWQVFTTIYGKLSHFRFQHSCQWQARSSSLLHALCFELFHPSQNAVMKRSINSYSYNKSQQDAQFLKFIW